MQTVPDLSGLKTHMTADITEFRGGIVRNFFFGQNGTVDLIFQVFVGGKGPEHFIQHSSLVILRNISPDIAGAAQNTGDAKKLFGL